MRSFVNITMLIIPQRIEWVEHAARLREEKKSTFFFEIQMGDTTCVDGRIILKSVLEKYYTRMCSMSSSFEHTNALFSSGFLNKFCFSFLFPRRMYCISLFWSFFI
jgi:hypothetical protein